MAKEFNISRTAGQCCQCGRDMAEQEEFMARVIDEQGQLVRRDWCMMCWPQRADTDGSVFGQWKSRVPAREAPKRTFVDDDVLVNFFHRLAEETDPSKVNFRFVLALMLMRKKLLTYEGAERDADGVEIWHMKRKGDDEVHRVVNPQLSEEQAAEVSEQLDEILEGDL